MNLGNRGSNVRPLLRVSGVSMAVLGLVIFSAALVSGGGTARADPPGVPPGQEPCSHGASDKPCREDPQPLHGKDCEPHGNNGGLNEDHCLASEETVSPEEPTPTSTAEAATPTSTAEAATPTSTAEAPTATATTEAPTATATEVVVTVVAGETPTALGPEPTVAGLPPAAPVEQSAVLGASQQPSTTPASLPRTGNGGYGNESRTVLFAGMALIIAGGFISLMTMRSR